MEQELVSENRQLYIETSNELQTVISNRVDVNDFSILAISGFCGSGKSTLGRIVASHFDAPLVSIDDFIVGPRDHTSDDWSTFDRERLKAEVIEPAKPGETIDYLKFDSGEYVAGLPGTKASINIGKLIALEGVGLFTDELLECFDITIWINCPYDESMNCAKQRSVGTADYFDTIWGPNDQRFFDKFRPDLRADIIYKYEC